MPKIKEILNNQEEYKKNLIQRRLEGLHPQVEEGIRDYQQLLVLKKLLQEKRTELNKTNKMYVKEKDSSLLQKAKEIKEEIKKLEEKIKFLEEKIKNVETVLPNWLCPDVPIGAGEEKEKPIKYVGIPKVYEKNVPSFIQLYPAVNFEKINYEPFHHYYLVDKYVDQDKAGEISGSRFYYMLGDLVKLDLAISLYALEFFIKKGYADVLMIPPYLMKKEIEKEITYFESFQDAIFNVEDDLILISTSEHPIVAYYNNSLFNPKNLPLKILAWSACFRKEAGAHGKDTKGIFRVKQFHKAEIHIITTKEDDYEEVFKLTELIQEFLSTLKIPNRSVFVPSGDMDRRALLQIDVESWFPAECKYRETHSIATTGTWISEKLNIRYGHSGGKKEFVRNVYATAVAVERLICSIVENHYNPKRKVIEIPDVLHKYTLGVKEIKL